MGLDMFIYSFKEGFSPKDRDKIWEKDIPYEEIHKLLDDFSKEEAYWRKANSIHGWFVENVQNNVDNCEYYKVSKEKFSELLEKVNRAIDTKDMKLIPPTPGFFFGDTEVLEYWLDDMKSTKEQISNILENWDDSRSYYYASSW